MFSLIINTLLVILLVVNTIMDYKKIRIEKENDQLYQSIKEKISEVQIEVHSYVKNQKKGYRG